MKGWLDRCFSVSLLPSFSSFAVLFVLTENPGFKNNWLKKGPSLEFGLVSILLFSSAGLISFWHVRRPPIYWPFYTFIPIHCVYSFSCRGMIFLCFTVNLEPAMDSKLLCFLFNSIQLTFHVQVHVHPLCLIHNLNLHVAH